MHLWRENKANNSLVLECREKREKETEGDSDGGICYKRILDQFLPGNRSVAFIPKIHKMSIAGEEQIGSDEDPYMHINRKRLRGTRQMIY